MYTEDSMGLRESHWSPLVSLGLWWSSLVFKSLASAGVCLAGLQESPLCGSSVHVRVLLERSPLCTTYSASLWGGGWGGGRLVHGPSTCVWSDWFSQVPLVSCGGG